jgi:hypothetical protein
MYSGHKRSADDGESAEATARAGALPAQETPSVRGGEKKSKAEEILNRSSAATEQFEKKKMTEDAYNAAILEMKNEFVLQVVFKARVFDRSLDETCHGYYVYGEDGVKELTRKAVEAECECAFHALSKEEKTQFFYRNVGYDDEFHACGSFMTIPSPIKLRRVMIASGATGEKRECIVSSKLSDADLVGAIRQASEKVLGRADGYAIAITKFTTHPRPERPERPERIHKLNTREKLDVHFEGIMRQQVYEYYHNLKFY